MYKKYFNTIGLAIIIPIIFLYAFQQGVSLAYNYWLSMWADDPIVNGTQIDTDLKLTVFGALGFVQGQFKKADPMLLRPVIRGKKCFASIQVSASLEPPSPSPSAASSPPVTCTWTY